MHLEQIVADYRLAIRQHEDRFRGTAARSVHISGMGSGSNSPLQAGSVGLRFGFLQRETMHRVTVR